MGSRQGFVVAAAKERKEPFFTAKTRPRTKRSAFRKARGTTLQAQPRYGHDMVAMWSPLALREVMAIVEVEWALRGTPCPFYNALGLSSEGGTP